MTKSGRMPLRHCALPAAALIASWSGSSAHAQSISQQSYLQENSTLIDPAIPTDYDRGRNVSVLEQARPDYDPLGIRFGGFLLRPRLDLGAGASDNIFLSATGRESDGYALIAPSAGLNSDWDRNQLILSGGGRFRQYFTYPRRNQDEWDFKGLGRLDVGSDFSLTGEGQVERVQEQPFTGEVQSDIAALSSYRRNFGSLRGQFEAGRIRTIIALDHQDYRFSTIELADGGRFDQSNRNRRINRVSGQIEYAFSPATSVYAQVGYIDTNYDTDLSPGIANRDSTGYRAIAGISVDAAGLLRGTVGLGYTSRDYKSPLYKDVHGVSAEAKIEYFPSVLTTVTLNLRRVIEDSNIGVTSAYFDNRISLRVDHEVARQLVLSLSGQYSKQDYIASPDDNRIWQSHATAHYYISRSIGLLADLSYGNRHQFTAGNSFGLRETAGSLTIVFQQ